MTWKWSGIVIGLVLVTGMTWCVAAEAATRGIPGITSAATMWGDTIKTLGWIATPALIIVAVLELRRESGWGVAFSVFGALLVVGIVLFADDIVATIKPGAALAMSGSVVPNLPSWAAWWGLGQQLLSVLGLAEGIRRARHARRV